MQAWRQKLKIIPVLTLCTAVATAWIFGGAANAAANQLYLSPSSQTVTTGNTFTVSLRVSPAVAIDTVNAYVGYNASQLSLQSVSCSGSPLTAFPSCPTGGNPINVTSADLTGKVSSDSLVATFTFKVTAASGSSSLTLSGDTATGGSSDGATSKGATVNVGAAACPSGQTGTPPNCTTPSSGGSSSSSSAGGSSKPSSSSSTKPSGTSTSKPSAAAPSATPVELGSPTILFTQATFTATSSSPTQVYLQYGTSKDALTSQTPISNLATSHQITLDAKTLAPGQTYYYVVVSKNRQGIVTQTAVQSFTTKGLTIKVGVFDKNHKPLRNKTVTLHSTAYTTKTDANGFATFSNIMAGMHHLTYIEGDHTYDETISVINNVQTSGDTQTAPIQNVSVVLPLSQRGSLVAAWWPYVVIAIVVIVGVWMYLNRNRFHRDFAHEPVLTSGAAMVVSDKTPPTPTATDVSVSQPGSDDSSKNDKLASIPDPDKPMPGSTVAPNSNDDHGDHDHEKGGT